MLSFCRSPMPSHAFHLVVTPLPFHVIIFPGNHLSVSSVFGHLLSRLMSRSQWQVDDFAANDRQDYVVNPMAIEITVRLRFDGVTENSSNLKGNGSKFWKGSGSRPAS